MGLEWHNRRRDKHGKFISDWTIAMSDRPVQIHIRMPWLEYKRVRDIANRREMELAEYIRKALNAQVAVDRKRLNL